MLLPLNLYGVIKGLQSYYVLKKMEYWKTDVFCLYNIELIDYLLFLSISRSL